MIFIIFLMIFSVLIHIKIVSPFLFLIFFIMTLTFLWVSYDVQLMRKQQFKKNLLIYIFVDFQMNSWIIFSNVKVKCSRVVKHNLILLVYKAHKICHSSSTTCALIETTLNISRKTRRRLLFFRLVAGFYGFASCLTLDFPGYMHDSRSMIL